MASHEWTRVVVLRSATDGVRDERLSAIFAARDWFAIEHTNPYQAMAELCLRERAQASRAGWGLQRVEKTALVIVDSADVPERDDLVRAVQRHLPAASIWSYADSELTVISDSQPTPTARMRHEPTTLPFPRPITRAAAPAITQPAPAPKLHAPPSSNLRPAPVSPQAPSLKSQDIAEEPHAPAGRISREEIDMLLRADSDNSPPLPFVPSQQRQGGSGSGS